MSIEAMKQALGALLKYPMTEGRAIQALRQAIEQAEKQEPVAYIDHVSGKPKFINGYVVQTDYDIPLYTAPPRKEWVGLTVDEIVELSESEENTGDVWMTLNVQARLKEKNNGN